jgi:hypothetical protein
MSIGATAGGEFAAVFAGRLGQLGTSLAGPLAVIRATLTGSFGQLSAAFTDRLGQWVAPLTCLFARAFHHGCAFFTGCAGQFGATFASGLDQRFASLDGRAGQFATALCTHLKAMRDSFAKFGIQEAAVGAIQRQLL